MASDSFGPMRRATRSVVLPGGKPTTMCTAFCFGQSCAAAAAAKASERMKKAKRFMGTLPRADATIPAPMNILFASETEKAEFWLPLLQKALPQDRFVTGFDQ